MSTMKKILSLTLALAMLMSVSVFAGFADAAEIDKDAAAAVELLTAVKILNGIPQEDGTIDFAPAATIKRAEAAKMIYVLRNGGVDDGAKNWKGIASFEDCKDHWANGYIAYCEAYGIINGRTETVFDPEAPVTGVELAKMLLTVAGYKGDVEGFTGTGWEKRVIAEANAAGEAGLFNGTEFAITTAAPRQWAAVMFVNAFTVKVPTYIGDYRVDASILGKDAKVETVASKFLDYNDERVTYVIATETASLNGNFAKKGEVILADGKTETFAVSDALVGQQVKVTTINEEIVSIAATGKTIAGELKVTKNAADPNKGKYTVVVGGTTLKTDAEENYAIARETAKAVADEQAAKKTTRTVYLAYDIEGDKAVDWVVKTTTTYGEVSAIATDKDNKGDFSIGGFKVDVSKTDVYTVEGTMKKGIVAKYTVDGLTGKVTVAPADVVVGAFTGISGTGADAKFTIGGTQYQYAADALEKTYLSSDTITKLVKDTIILYTDGKYIVKADSLADDEPADTTTPTELPSKLAYIIAGSEVLVPGSDVNEWGNASATKAYTYKVKVMLADGTTAIYELETDKDIIKDATDLTVAELFTGEEGKKTFVDKYVGGVYEYAMSGSKIVIKQTLAAVKDVVFYGDVNDGVLTVDNTIGKQAEYQTNTMFKDTLIRGTENTLVFAKYTNDKNKVSYKVIKLADLLAADTTQVSTKIVAATKASIGEALLVVAEYKYEKDEVVAGEPETPYVVIATAPEYVVEDGKVYQVFTAVDLNNAGAAKSYKAAASVDLKLVKANAIVELTVVDGLVTVAAAPEATWVDGSVQAKVADLLLVDYNVKDEAPAELVENTNKFFAKNCKIIVKNGTAYTAGTYADLVVAKQDADNNYKANISYVLNDAGAFTYVIIDLAK